MPLPALSLPRRRPPARAVAGCACVLALLGGAWLWLRDSGLVAVDQVSVTGLSGTEAPRVRAALEGAARDMTTLHVRPDQLRTAVEPYPSIMAVDAHPDFPHGLRIVVHEHVAVAALASGSDRVPVAADGTLLRGSSTGGLPVVAVAAPPPGDALTDQRTLRVVSLLAAAPPDLRAKVSRVYPGPRGLTAPLTNGPILYFGGADRLRAKWTAAASVLADRSSAGATYIDLRLPERPAAGGLEDPTPAAPEQPTQSSPQVGAQPAQTQTQPSQPQTQPVGP
ncbi:MAG: cell division protein FtsQ/DivIB [Solirubrobacteraceae bacterium]